MRSYAQTIEAADRTAGRVAEGPDALRTLTIEASAARAAGDTDAAEQLDAAAQRLRDAIAGVVLTGLRIAAEQQPADLKAVIRDATDRADADQAASG